MLKGLRILIVEDEHLVAMDLAAAIEELDGHPIGPVPTVEEALLLLQTEEIAAAILDANLLDRDITPVATILAENAVPFVIHTGASVPPDLAARYPDLPVVPKPAGPTTVLAALLQLVSADRSWFE